MCYHTSTPDKELLVQEFPEKIVVDNYQTFYHTSGFERPFLPTTTNDRPNYIHASRWKLIPFWVKTEAEAKKYANTLNAEYSEIFEKASYRNFIGKNRGLLYVNGFYEPHKVEGQKETENFYIYMPDRKPFTLGIVFAPWTDQETGERIDTFSIITVPANEMMAEIHNEKRRMPLVILPEERERWLTAKTKEDIQTFFKPLPDGILQAHKINYRVTAARGVDTNIPEVQAPAL